MLNFFCSLSIDKSFKIIKYCKCIYFSVNSLFPMGLTTSYMSSMIFLKLALYSFELPLKNSLLFLSILGYPVFKNNLACNLQRKIKHSVSILIITGWLFFLEPKSSCTRSDLATLFRYHLSIIVLHVLWINKKNN